MKLKTPPRQLKEKRLKIFGVVIGKLAGATRTGVALVDYPRKPSARLYPARSVVAFGEMDIGRDVVLMFEQGKPSRPIIMGFVQSATGDVNPVQADVDGERLLLTAEREIVLRCGKSSITLTQCGKIILRGAYLLSRSSGANHIKGASVGIN